jgi:hypothetical protein
MGLLSSLAGIAAPIVGTALGGPAGGALGGALGGLFGGSGSKQTGTQTTTQQLDPRVQSMLFGDGTSGNSGLLAQYQGMLNKPQDPRLAGFGNQNLNYLTDQGGQNLNGATWAGQSLLNGNQAPTSTAAQAQSAQVGAINMGIPSYVGGTMVNAPNQNNIDLTGSYKNLLSGGDTSALMNSLQAGNNLTSAQFQKNQTDVTNNLTRNALPQIRGGAIAAGQYGSSRQGIAEGNALSDYTNQLTSANTQLSAANSANTANALAGAYENGQNRALSATQGLGAQQYGVASQNANIANQAETQNVQNQFNAAQYNAGLLNQANMFNSTNNQNTGLYNASNQQQTNLANQAAQLNTNAQNNGSLAAGAGLLSGLNSQAYGVGNAQNNYGLTQAQGVNSLLQPYLSQSSGSSSSAPLYSNPVGSALGGALAGGQLGGLLGGLSGGQSSLYNSSTPSSIASYQPSLTTAAQSLPNFWG